VLVATERYDEAYDHATRATAISFAAYSDDHWRTAIATSAAGAALAGLKQFTEAETLLLKSRTVLREDAGALPVFVAETDHRLARLYEDWNRPDEAEKYRTVTETELTAE